VLAIETPELRKAPGVACAHCTAQGCGIYETRFPICRSYFCGWHGLPELDDSWRPDASGLVLSPRDGGIEFLAFGGEAALRRAAFLDFLAQLIAEGTPAFLSVPGPPGHYPARTPLNAPLSRIERARWGDALAGALAAAQAHRFERMPQ
jgi:hypothetical protein